MRMRKTMSDKTLTDRLQPSLLDRLTDNEPGSAVESRDDRVIDLRRLREIITRDLSWLLNTSDNTAQIDVVRYPNVVNSVLNFGIREIAGDYSNTERIQKIRSSIRAAIERFEPRIKPGTLDVILRDDIQGNQAIVAFDIRADMWAQPLPMELYLRSQIDVTTGELTLQRKV